MGLALEDVRTAISNTNAVRPVLAFRCAESDRMWVRSARGGVVQRAVVAWLEVGVRDLRAAPWFNGQPGGLLVNNKQANSTVIETVDRIDALLRELKRWLPAGIDISVLSD